MEPPYIWMRSGKLRNPLNPPAPGRPVSRTPSGGRRPDSCTSSRSARRVKTTTSTQWFHHSQLPDYIRAQVPVSKNGPRLSTNDVSDASLLNTDLDGAIAGKRKSWLSRKDNDGKTVNEVGPIDLQGRVLSPQSMSGRQVNVPELQLEPCASGEEESENGDVALLCPNVHRRSSSLAGLKTIVDRLGSSDRECLTPVQVRPKSTHHKRKQCASPQPRTSSAKAQSQPVPGLDSGALGGTTSPPDIAVHRPDSVQGREGHSPSSFGRTPTLRKAQWATIRPFTSVHTAVKVKRVLDERLRNMYNERRIQSATLRRRPEIQTSPSTGRRSVTPRRSPLPPSPQSMAEGEDGETETTARISFRRIVRFIVWLRSAVRANIAQSCANTPRSATELQWMTVYAEREDTSLTFNKHLFSRERVTSHVPDWAQEILCLAPDERSEAQCRRLHALLRGLKSFDKFTEEIQLAFCRAFTMERVEERRVVLKKGHVGQNFYFIYSGSVFVNQDDTSRDGTTFVRTVAVLARGDSFGELALLRNIRRMATITVRERCELLVVEKSVFASVCPAIFERELEEKHNFIRSLNLFSGKWWTQDALRDLSLNSQIQEFKTNKVIAADSALEDWIYACMEGCCQIVRCICLDRPQKDHGGRRTSEIVLSEEILQLLSSTALDSPDRGPSSAGETKENLLTSLGLEYVNTGKKLASMDINLAEQKRARLGLDGASTLTALMKRQREVLQKELVYIDVGRINAGEVFDLKSIIDHGSAHDDNSSLMLISGGAKVLKIRKGAFYERANQQAIDHTRALANKEKNPSEDVLLHSYKEKVAWEEYKDGLVKRILANRKQRHAPLYRDKTDANLRKPAPTGEKRQIMSALKERSKGAFGRLEHLGLSDTEDSDEEDDQRNRIQSRMGETESIFQAILKESEQKSKANRGQPSFADMVIIHRKPPPPGKKVRVSKDPGPPVKSTRPYRKFLDTLTS